MHTVGDQRTTVLLLVGLFLLLAGSGGRTAPGRMAEKAGFASTHTMLWLSCSNIAEGIYSLDRDLLPPIAADFDRLYNLAGLKPPSELSDASLNILPQNYQTKACGLLLADRAEPRLISVSASMHALFFEPVPVNKADRELLITVPGIGPRLAEQIIKLRQEKKRLSAPNELLALHGIGRHRLQQISRYLSFQEQ